MGQKVNPIGFRTGIVYGWKSVWYASGEDVAKNLLIDYKIRTILMEEFKENESDRNRSRNKRSDKKKKDEGAAPEVGVDKDFSAAPLVPVKVNRDFPAAPSLKKKVCFTNIEIERERGENGLIKICIHMKCDRPSEVTLREGQVRPKLEKLTGSPVIFDVDINDEDCLNATFTAEKIGEKIQQRVSYKRAINEYIKRVMEKGARGIKVLVSGRLSGAEIARQEKFYKGKVPTSTIRANIDYCCKHVQTTSGLIGLKVWIFKGDFYEKPKILLVSSKSNKKKGDVKNRTFQFKRNKRIIDNK